MIILKWVGSVCSDLLGSICSGQLGSLSAGQVGSVSLNFTDINVPLIGNGLSRVGLPPSQLLQLTLISLLKSAKERDLSSTIRIVLTEDIFEKIDLEIIKNNWE